jgi:hypothetical protein
VLPVSATAVRERHAVGGAERVERLVARDREAVRAAQVEQHRREQLARLAAVVEQLGAHLERVAERVAEARECAVCARSGPIA